jgi:hypothetical protein
MYRKVTFFGVQKGQKNHFFAKIDHFSVHPATAVSRGSTGRPSKTLGSNYGAFLIRGMCVFAKKHKKVTFFTFWSKSGLQKKGINKTHFLRKTLAKWFLSLAAKCFPSN